MSAFLYHVEGDRLYHAANAHVAEEKQTGRELARRDGRGGGGETRRENKCPGCTQPQRWRCVKVVVLSSDLIIYAAGCRGLPLRFTALRKQEQIERWMVLAGWREPNRSSADATFKTALLDGITTLWVWGKTKARLPSLFVVFYDFKFYYAPYDFISLVFFRKYFP